MQVRAVFRMLAVAALAAGLTGCGPAPASPPAVPAPSTPSATATPAPTPAALDEAAARLDALSMRQRLAAMLMLHYPGTDAGALTEFMRRTEAGGFIVMGDNVAGSSADRSAVVAALAVDASLPPLVAIDQEGGIVSRLDEDDYPAAAELRLLPPEASRDAFAARAQLVRQSGVGMNFGIVADHTDDRSSFIYDRVLGTTPEAAAARVEQAVAGERGLVLSTLKHFPGHGVSGLDSHTSLPESGLGWDAWRSGPAVPFERGIAAGAEAVMFGHLRLTSMDGAPASLSPRWHEILRDDLRFTGLAVTDDMLMLQRSRDPAFSDPLQNAIAAITAGNDLLVYVLAADPAVSGVEPLRLLDGLEAAVADGRIPQSRVDEAVLRLLEARIAIRDAR